MYLTCLFALFAFGDKETCDFSFANWPDLHNTAELVECNDASAPGQCLTANAGVGFNAQPGASVELNGLGTTVPHTPEELGFSWTQVDNGLPMVNLNNADTATPDFTATELGVYEFQLTVNWLCRGDTATVQVTITDVIEAPSELDVELVAFVDCPGGNDGPILVTHAPGDDRLFIVCQRGEIRIFKEGALLPTPFMNLSAHVTMSGGNEQGLLGMAFHPDFQTNGIFYLSYTGRTPTGTGTTRDNQIVGLTVDAGNPDLADTSSISSVMSISQASTETNHNGGNIAFGPDGFLYLGTGDGGGAGDVHGTIGNGQDPLTLLGKMVRVQVDGLNPVQVPASNPFVGDPDTLDEIWALGLRNPWRFSFDRANGDMYIGDVGQNAWEEISFQEGTSSGGENYGWRLMEGNNCFNPTTNCNPGGLTLPIFEFPHGSGNICSVTGGFVYRGSDIPTLNGFYIFADFCGSGSGSASAKRYWTLIQREGGEWEANDLNLFVDDNLLVANVTSFGEDNDGELYVAAGSSIYKITGIRN